MVGSTPTPTPSRGDVLLAAHLKQFGGRTVSAQVRDPSPRRVAAILAALGNPHRRYPAIHVTGTNGKGSTAAMTAGLLAQAGLRVGLYTGPHLVSATERVVIDGRAVDASALDAAVSDAAAAAEKIGIVPGWFEVVTVAGLTLFAASGVDVAVVEVGMLGLRDATNVLSAGIVVVTNVALDHETEAGGGRAAIAAAKAALVGPASTLILGEADPSLRAIFEDRRPAQILTHERELRWRHRLASAHGSRVDLENPFGVRHGIEVSMVGAHQCDNALLALTAAETFMGRRLRTSDVRKAAGRTRVKGRFEIRCHKPLVVLDGAHNVSAAAALGRSVAEISKRMAPRILVYGQSRGRDPFAFLRHCGVEHVDLILLTDSGGDTRPEVIDAGARSFGARVAVVKAPLEALRHAVELAGPRGLVVATGSLRLLGQFGDMPSASRA